MPAWAAQMAATTRSANDSQPNAIVSGSKKITTEPAIATRAPRRARLVNRSIP